MPFCRLWQNLLSSGKSSIGILMDVILMRRKLDKFMHTITKDKIPVQQVLDIKRMEKLHPWQICNNNINLFKTGRGIIGHVIWKMFQHNGKLRITELHNNTMTQLYYITLNISTQNSCNITTAWLPVCGLSLVNFTITDLT